MNNRFESILIPVDFSVNTEVAINKALQLCEDKVSVIHLLHIVPAGASAIFDIYGYFARSALKHLESEASIRERLAQAYSRVLGPRESPQVCYWISRDASVEKAIIKCALKISADLIVIGKNSQHRFFPFLNTVKSSRIARRSRVPVLTVKPGAAEPGLKMVVVPIDGKYPERKVDMILALRQKFRVHIRLLMLVDRDDDPDAMQVALLNICQVLKHYSIHNMSYEVIPARNKAADILRYSRKVNADLLIVNPGRETKMGWLDKHLSDEIPVSSRTQILAVTNA